MVEQNQTGVNQNNEGGGMVHSVIESSSNIDVVLECFERHGFTFENHGGMYVGKNIVLYEKVKIHVIMSTHVGVDVLERYENVIDDIDETEKEYEKLTIHKIEERVDELKKTCNHNNIELDVEEYSERGGIGTTYEFRSEDDGINMYVDERMTYGIESCHIWATKYPWATSAEVESMNALIEKWFQ